MQQHTCQQTQLQVHEQLNTQNSDIEQKVGMANKIQQDKNQSEFNIYFEYESDQIVQFSQISFNEKYFIIGGNDCKIHVYDIITKQIIKSIQLDFSVSQCIFTQDSNYIICGDISGYLFCFDINNNFYQKFKKEIHENSIIDIVPIDNNQIITCSFDDTIIITNMSLNSEQLLIQNISNIKTMSIEYDQQNYYIISGDSNASIKFFNRTNGLLQLEQQRAHANYVQKIQLIFDKTYNLLSSSLNDLILWQIDYHQKQLKMIIILQQKNFNFTSVADTNRIIMLCEKYIWILDKNLVQVQIINHNVKTRCNYYIQMIYYILVYYQMRQLNSMNYIIIPGEKNLQVFRGA